jgi:hypothetical protein
MPNIYFLNMLDNYLYSNILVEYRNIHIVWYNCVPSYQTYRTTNRLGILACVIMVKYHPPTSKVLRDYLIRYAYQDITCLEFVPYPGWIHDLWHLKYHLYSLKQNGGKTTHWMHNLEIELTY